ncbi:2-oxoglutarate dehydrogenase E1 component [Pseudogracilibacillus auburnensis]|uniref:2-oxoglutarate dehydrogenase E1 component n=1 Tax=Pseudogracilibacillus auburnensis TaxID=1494959 RepID=A0A2V3VZC5_9BACI|nr:2-oxoglutarate dehydrogenase E1 component [Pseudogracilibacillus auburnensis]MBO1005346.1 2-oxoglutarate dehydrogenase E1 component [Pseudogracilibacillus auburnensis]PXW86980.1 2-oxoglutarate dehydrogenase E1 component [Pseudogracilibacillus auburnensis]
MAQSAEPSEKIWGNFYGPNMGYVEEQYELYKEDPTVVDPTLKAMFDKHGAPQWMDHTGLQNQQVSGEISTNDVKKITSAMRYLDAIRRFGHLEADIYAVGGWDEKTNLLDPKTYNITDEDLKNIPATWLWDKAPTHVENGYDAVAFLRKKYTGKISFEYDHVNSDEERKWLLNRIESGEFELTLTEVEKKQLLERLINVEGFEHFLQKTFVGQKRFSIEGLESMVPVLDQIVKSANNDKIENIMMGMAHRGRLSVLAYVLGKPLDKIFSEFHHAPDKELMPSEGSMGINYGWSGDVKYHFGATREVKNDEASTRVKLAHNPSHLEFVNPVVAGFTRAAQDNRDEKGYPVQDLNKAIGVLIHGDAAFIGEGIVPETMNLSGLIGYRTGGTLHIIANNLIGFTTDRKESRSTRYASDLAKGYEIPIIRVNADDPIACIRAIQLAYEYSHEFKKDCVLDLVGYRRYGHNEMDEPRATQPILYSEIDTHPTVTEIFSDVLTNEGIVTADEVNAMKEKHQNELQAVYDGMKEDELSGISEVNMPTVLANSIDHYETAVPLEDLKKLNADLLNRPEDFKGFKRLERVFKRRQNILEEGHKADWGEGEALAFASILKDGIPIRITGQDSERGTFAHRHLVLYDTETGEKYCPMHGLEDANASFDIHNSPLSETAVLGFEYGYSIQSPETLVIWEAQFGDFANVAQVIFDQFISSARAKWGDKSNMVMLLPHGYEGQGPEHSSARLERFLQMAGENNWIVANVTSSAQFFHLLRRQAKMRGREEARPLVVMSPKSLLRNERVASEAKEFTEGKFLPLRNQPNLKVSKKNATRLLLGSGKVMVDIEEEIANADEKFDWLRALRVEQLYPFPLEQLKKEIDQLPNLEEIAWVQEEPKNMGSWRFVLEYLRDLAKDGQEIRYIGRPERASTSVGEPNIHKVIQKKVVTEAIRPAKGGNSSEGN